MLPSLMLFDSQPPQPGNRRSAKLAMVLGLVIAMLLGALLFAMRSMSGAMMPIILAVAVAIMLVVIAVLVVRAMPSDKAKHEIAEGDMYSLIDRMLPELDANERLYLQRKLDEMEAGKLHETPEELGALLDERIRERRERH